MRRDSVLVLLYAGTFYSATKKNRTIKVGYLRARRQRRACVRILLLKKWRYVADAVHNHISYIRLHHSVRAFHEHVARRGGRRIIGKASCNICNC